MRVRDVPTRNEAKVLLVGADGRILWRYAGAYDPASASQITELVALQTR